MWSVLLLCLGARAEPTGSPLWDDLLAHCSRGPFLCVQDRLRSFVERSLQADLNLTESVSFTRNGNSFSWPERRVRRPDPGFERFVDSVELAENSVYGPEDAAASPGAKYNVWGLADLLYDKGVGYLMNHDLHVRLPGLLGGGTLSLSPRSLDEDGALVKLRYTEQDTQVQPQGRILFKRIKKFFNRKLLTSFLAALLIIALLKIKILFFFPLILGVGAAKKLLLKVLLFLFPALTHLFKLCAFYHHQHVKYHHHHHQVAHHHHHVPVHVGHGYHELPEYLDHPPPGYIHRIDPDVELSTWGIEAPDDSYSGSYNSRRKYESSNYHDSLNHPPNIQDTNMLPSKNVLSLGGVYDPFYSPILEKLDEIFAQLGFQEEGCRERLVCSMYKAPSRFSPHSNLVSAQLSRDPSELQKPGYSNAAVMRFYKYVQAARDGQDFKNCLLLYPSCTVITE